ncbi:MAG: hypothetical protein E6G46_04215, partial [Actinobacteria bacterium]
MGIVVVSVFGIGAEGYPYYASVFRPSEYDRDIVRLAVPALGSLAAEPLYVLVDTAVVGHLGRAQLGGLAVAGTLLTTAFLLFNFLAYGTTATVARAVGARDRRRATGHAVQALWVSATLGLVLLALGIGLASPAVSIMGARGARADVPSDQRAGRACGARGPRRDGVRPRVAGHAHRVRRRRHRQRVQPRARARADLRLRVGDRRVGVGNGDRAVRRRCGLRRDHRPRRAHGARLARAGSRGLTSPLRHRMAARPENGDVAGGVVGRDRGRGALRDRSARGAS